MDKRKWFLLFWLAAMLFPYNIFLKYSNKVQSAVSFVVSSELAHVIGHTLLFAGMVVLVLHIFHLPLNGRTAFLLALGVLIVGLGQEFFQLQVKERSFGGPEVFDLAVDMVGGALGWWVYRMSQRYGRYLRMAYYLLKEA